MASRERERVDLFVWAPLLSSTDGAAMTRRLLDLLSHLYLFFSPFPPPSILFPLNLNYSLFSRLRIMCLFLQPRLPRPSLVSITICKSPTAISSAYFFDILNDVMEFLGRSWGGNGIMLCLHFFGDHFCALFSGHRLSSWALSSWVAFQRLIRV